MTEPTHVPDVVRKQEASLSELPPVSATAVQSDDDRAAAPDHGPVDSAHPDGDGVALPSGAEHLWQLFGEYADHRTRDRLVLHYAPLVKYVAGRVGTGLPTHVDVNDLVQSGVFGLVDAIEKFDPQRGQRF